MIPYGKHQIDWRDAISVAWQTRFRSLTQGERITLFERRIAEYVGAKYAVAVSSATAGLHLSILALNLPKNSEVITSPISFVATSNSVLYAGLKPIFSDIQGDTLTLDFRRLREVTSPNSKALISVHFAGLPDEPNDLIYAREHLGLRVIEDAAHSLGASYACGRKVGSCAYSDITVFSLHPVKSITSGEGGVITTNDHLLYKRLLRLRSHGINKLEDSFEFPLFAKTADENNFWYYEMLELGFNYRLTEIQAQLGISQLNKLDSFIRKRSALVERYKALVGEISFVQPAQSADTSRSGHHIFPILIDFDQIGISRQRLMKALRHEGIGTQVHYIPIPFQPHYRKLGYQVSGLENALAYYFRALSIPLFPSLSNKQQDKVVASLQRIVL